MPSKTTRRHHKSARPVPQLQVEPVLSFAQFLLFESECKKAERVRLQLIAPLWNKCTGKEYDWADFPLNGSVAESRAYITAREGAKILSEFEAAAAEYTDYLSSEVSAG